MLENRLAHTRSTSREDAGIELSGAEHASADTAVLRFVVPVIVKREIRLIPLTPAEIDGYRFLGVLADFMIACFGVASGYAISCLVAIQAGGLSPQAEGTMASSSVVSGLGALVFLAVAVCCWVKRSKDKSQWEQIGANGELRGK